MIPATTAEVEEAVRLARTSARAWQQTSPADRAACVRAAAQRVRECADERPEMSVSSLRIFNIAGPGFPDSLVSKLRRATPDEPAVLVERSAVCVMRWLLRCRVRDVAPAAGAPSPSRARRG
jgi:nucleoside-diphosphate-sugar epimerase